MVWYIVLYVLGIVVAWASPLKDVEYILAMVNPIAVTALIASLLVPFAAFGRNEKVQKWLVQYAIVPLFGMYTVLAWHKGSLVGVVILIGAASVHGGYWMSSLHSRMYRVEQFKLGFQDDLPATARVIARLNGVGDAQIADEIVRAILRGESVPDDVFSRAQRIVGEKMVRKSKEEATNLH